MRAPNKSRSRNNKNRRSNHNAGNIVNRVFDSSGPDGRVRGTPNQIIEKYEAHARDAVLSGDRVMAENFQQHSEHYIRLLGESKAEMAQEQAARQAEEDARRIEREDKRVQEDVAPVEIVEEMAVVETQTSEDESESEVVEVKPKTTRRRKSPVNKGFESSEDIPDFLKTTGDTA